MVNEISHEGKYSIRQLMLFIFAVAIGLAVGRIPQFGFIGGCFATASILVIARLAAEIRLLRSNTTIAAPCRRFQQSWRALLIASIGIFFVLTVVANSDSSSVDSTAARLLRLSSYRGMFTTWANAPLIMYQMAIFCFLKLNAPVRPAFRKMQAARITGVAVWVFYIAVQLVPVILLVQFAIEAMEYTAAGAIVGPTSQYASDSWGLYSGIDPDTNARTTKFTQTSILAIIPMLLLLPAFSWAMGQLKSQGARLSRVSGVLFVAIAMAAIYPVWLFTGGLRQFCPAYAEVGLDAHTTSLLAGILALLLMSLFLAYRILATAPSADSYELNLNRIDLGTLATIGLANVAWCISSLTRLEPFDLLEYFKLVAMLPDVLICGAVLTVIGKELYSRTFNREQAPLSVYAVGLQELRLLSAAIFVSILVAAPTILWSAYSVAIMVLHM